MSYTIGQRGCMKRRYTGVRAALAAHRSAGHRLRAYRCEQCGGWHVTNADKNPPNREPLRSGHWKGGERLQLAPALSLAELEAIAAQKRGLSR